MFFGGIGEVQTQAALATTALVVREWQVVDEDEGDGHTVQFLWLLAQKRE